MKEAGETARAVFTCGARIDLPHVIGKMRCNRTLETNLYNNGQYTYFYTPDEWHIELGYIVSQGANTVVRCPEHCRWAEGRWKDAPGAGLRSNTDCEE